MSRTYKKNIAVFLIVLIATMPFYVSSVFAQNQPFETSSFGDPVQSCIAKAEEGRDLVEALDSGPIKTLEGIVSTLHFTCTAWSTLEIAKNTYNAIVGTFDKCVGPPGTPEYALCVANSARITADIPLKEIMVPLCNKVECKENFIADALPDNIGDPISDLQTKIRGIGAGPFDNIYSSIAYLCPTGILFNLRKLKTIYQTHSCCIQEACTAGVSTESCERQLSEATCMYWQGSIALSAIKILLSFVSEFITNLVKDDVKELIGEGIGEYIEAIMALANAFEHIQRLQETFEWMSRTFSEPNCSDLNFDDIIDEKRTELRPRLCNLIEIDINNDGIFDRIEPRCT